MKKSILTLGALLVIKLASFAQAEKGTTRIIAGWGAPNIAAAVLSDVDKQTGPIHFGVKHFFSDKISVGLIYNYSDATTKPYLYNDGTNAFAYKYDAVFSTFLANVDYSWKSGEKHNLYSGLGLGFVNVSASATITTGTGDAPKFTAAASGLGYHVTAIGYHGTLGAGFGAYAELGYGYNGLINAGLSYSIH